jgi:Chaperone of endosialidase
MRDRTISSRTSVGLVCLLLFTASSLIAQDSNSGSARREAAQIDSVAATQPRSATGARATGNAQVTVPRLIRFNGVLQDLTGKPIAGPVDVTFSLYAEQSGSSPLWFETQTVQASSLGHYTVLLGAMTPAGVPMELFTGGEARWLGVQVSNLPEQPRVLLVSVPYAMKAGDAETLGGRPASEYQLTQAAESSSKITARRGTTTTDRGASSTTASKSQHFTSQTIIATPNYIPVFTNSDGSMNNSVMYQSNGRIGIGTTTPFYGLDINANVIAVGTTVPKPGYAGSLRFRDDTGTPRWLFGILGSSGATNFNVSDMISHFQPFIARPGAPTNSLVLTPNGVGIGTAAPVATLDVNGNINLPVTGNSSVGVISVGGTPFIHNCCANNGEVFVGPNAGNFGNTGSANVGVGQGALETVTTGSYNTAMGYGALFANTTGFENTAVGAAALDANSTGVNNTAVGGGALLSTTGSGNTSVGTYSLYDNTTGASNASLGAYSLFHNTTGSYNTAVGDGAGYAGSPTATNISGSYNAYMGYNTGPSTSTQLTNSTAIGAQAAVGENNALVLGSIQGVNGATSSVKVGIGTSTPGALLDVAGASGTDQNPAAKFGSPGAADNNAIRIYDGSGVAEVFVSGAASDFVPGTAQGDAGLRVNPGKDIVFGDSGLERMTLLSNGSVGIGTDSPSEKLDVIGDIRAANCFVAGNTIIGGTCISDARLKTNIQPFPQVLDKLTLLQPVHFEWRKTLTPGYYPGPGRSAGLIAQEVQKVFPDMVSTDAAGYRRINYGELQFLLLEGVRELKAENDRLKQAADIKDEKIVLLARQVHELRNAQAQMSAVEARLKRLETELSAIRHDGTPAASRVGQHAKPSYRKVARVQSQRVAASHHPAFEKKTDGPPVVR